MGAYMVELLIAIATSSMLAAALVGSMAESERLSSFGQNEILVAAIAQEQIDSTRNTPYDYLDSKKGLTYELKVAPSSAYGTTDQRFAPRELLLDSSKFQGRVYEKIESGPYANTLKVTITINWQEGQSTRSYVLSTLIAKNGINSGGAAGS